MNTKIQKLIHYNEKVMLHFQGDKVITDSEMFDCFLESEKLLHEITKDSLSINEKLKDQERTIKGQTEIKKNLNEMLFDNIDNDSNNLEIQYKLANGFKHLKLQCSQLIKENAQLKSELEILKEKEINRFGLTK